MQSVSIEEKILDDFKQGSNTTNSQLFFVRAPIAADRQDLHLTHPAALKGSQVKEFRGYVRGDPVVS